MNIEVSNWFNTCRLAGTVVIGYIFPTIFKNNFTLFPKTGFSSDTHASDLQLRYDLLLQADY